MKMIEEAAKKVAALIKLVIASFFVFVFALYEGCTHDPDAPPQCHVNKICTNISDYSQGE